eukprot:jgi/Psemu1/17504/gm1.17504_g
MNCFDEENRHLVWSSGLGPMTQAAAFDLLGMVNNNNRPPRYTEDPAMKNIGAELSYSLQSDDENTYAPAIELAPDTDT